MLICDGPCHGIVDYTKMMEYPDCGHKICKMCQYNEISVPNVDGGLLATVAKNNVHAIFGLTALTLLIHNEPESFNSGSPGCCVPTCVRQTLINRVPLEKYR